MSSEQGSPFKFLWQFQYPFAYWDNRLEKINPYNEQDRLEALYSLVQLTDIYAHIFAAYVRNPEQPWFFVKENTFRGDIDGVLDKLRTEGMATVGTLSENPEGLATFEANEEYDLHELDAIVGALLGCPFTIDEETGSVEFDESPDIYRGVCNAILDFAENNTALLNDFKHGFRTLPAAPDSIEHIVGSPMLLDERDEDAFEETLDMLREELEEAEWGFCFARMQEIVSPSKGLSNGGGPSRRASSAIRSLTKLAHIFLSLAKICWPVPFARSLGDFDDGYLRGRPGQETLVGL